MSGDFDAMWADLEPVGRDPRGGYRRFAWTDTDEQLREWFAAEAARR
ncbi:allantoate amidohydrolase, partial [Jiangella aurantiaca]